MTMAEQEISLAYIASELAIDAVLLRQDKSKQGKDISPPSAIAHAWLKTGRTMIMEVLKPLMSYEAQALSLEHYLTQIKTDQDQQKLLLGFGGGNVASIILSIEMAIVSGWDDENYMSLYQEFIRGTPLPVVRLEQLRQHSLYRPVDPWQESGRLLEVAMTDHSFGRFLTEFKLLPPVVQAYISSFSPPVFYGFGHATTIYLEALEQLSKQPSHIE